MTPDRAKSWLTVAMVAGVALPFLLLGLLHDNADPKANDIYAALDMPFATLMGQVASALSA